MSGFKKFILRGNVIDLAVAVVIGAAFTAVVNAFVEGVLTPLIGIFGNIPDFSAWTVTIGNSQFAIGAFINAVIAFLLIALVVYFLVVMPMNRLMEMRRGAEEKTTKDCPECLSEIPLNARRCKFCTAVLVQERVA